MVIVPVNKNDQIAMGQDDQTNDIENTSTRVNAKNGLRKLLFLFNHLYIPKSK